MSAPAGSMIVSMRLAIDTSEIAKFASARGDIQQFGAASATAGAQARVLSAAIEEQVAAARAADASAEALAASLGAVRAAAAASTQAATAAATSTTAQAAALKEQAAAARASDGVMVRLTTAVEALTQATGEAVQATSAGTRATMDHAAALVRIRASSDEASRASASRTGLVRTEAAAEEAAARAAVERGQQVRAAYDPAFAAMRQYRTALADIRQAEATGAFGVGPAGARRAVEATRQAREEVRAYIREVRASQAPGSGGRAPTGPVRWGDLEAWQKQQLMPQVFDIATTLGSGMSPGIVAIQQGPQIIQAVGGFRNALTIAVGAINPASAAIGALAVVAGSAAIALQSHLTSVKAVETAAATTGRSAGATPARLEQIARDNASAGGVSVTDAREMMVAFLSAQQIGSEYFGEMIQRARDFGAAIRTDAIGGAEKLTEVLKDPARGAKMLADDYGLLTGAQARSIARLAERGQEDAARQAILDQMPDLRGTADRTKTAVGRGIAPGSIAASNTWDAFGSYVSRGWDQLWGQMSDADRLRQIEAQMQSGPSGAIGERYRARLQRERDEVIGRLSLDQGLAAGRGTETRDRRAGDRALAIADASPATADARQRLALEQQIAALRKGLPGLEGAERERATSALQGNVRVLDALNNRQSIQNTLTRLDLEIARERNPERVKELTIERDTLRINQQNIDDAEAARQVASARDKASAEAAAKIRDASQALRDQAASTIAATEQERAAIGRSAAEIARAQTETALLATAKEKAGSARPVSPEDVRLIRDLAEDAAKAAAALATLRARTSLATESAQLGRPEIDAAVAARMEASGVDPRTVDGQLLEKSYREQEYRKRGYTASAASPANADARQREQYQTELKALNAALPFQTGPARAQTEAAIQATTRALQGLESQQARVVELERLDLAIQRERDPSRRAALQTRRAELALGAQALSDAQLAEQTEAARRQNAAEAAAELSEISRARASAAAEEVAAADRETAAIGQTAGQIARAEAAARMLADAKERAGSIAAISPAERAEIERYADAIGKAADRQAAVRVSSDLAFERAQLDRNPTEQRVAETLRSARIDPTSAEGQRTAAQVREIEGIKAQREALADLRNDMASYLDQIDAASDKWETAGDIAEDMLQQLVSDLRKYALGSALGVQTPVPGILQMFGIGRQAAQPAPATPAPSAAPASGFAPAAQPTVPVTTGAASALPALSAAYRGRSGGLDGLDQTFGGRLDAFLAANPGVSVTSAYRTPEQQRVLWEDALRQYGSPEIARKHVAPPGASYHNRGMAADLAYSSPSAREQAHQTAGDYGLKFPLANENWHVEPAWTRGGRDTTGAAAAIDRLAVSADGAAGATGALQGGFETVSNALQAGGGNIAQAAGGLTGAATKLTEGAAGATESAQGLFATIGSGLDSLISGIGALFSGGRPAGGAGAAAGSAGASAGGIGSMIFSALSAVWPFEAGGVMTARGPIPLRAYATGGVASSPQLALYGEGAHAEAYVPLPDGRTIPVTMRTTGGSAGGAPMVALTQLAGQLGAIQSRLAQAASGSRGEAGSSGSAGLQVQVVNNVGAKVTTQEERSETGGRRLSVVLDEEVAKATSSRSSKTRKAWSAGSVVRRR